MRPERPKNDQRETTEDGEAKSGEGTLPHGVGELISAEMKKPSKCWVVTPTGIEPVFQP